MKLHLAELPVQRCAPASPPTWLGAASNQYEASLLSLPYEACQRQLHQTREIAVWQAVAGELSLAT
ncbi:MAG TPA: hypothetical protein VJV79_20400 [Polyangiaceae bacterium]|nr:hypothetical protein [Polyangiaceae bacterium]